MQLSEQWLREWVNPPVDTGQLASALTMLGLEVDSVQPVASAFSGVVVALVVRCEPHPDAERLRSCQVDIGSGAWLPVVCGASNVRQGLKVAFAQIGSVLPQNFLIKKAKLRGVESHGMICSFGELGMKEEGDGIIELAPEAPIGMDFRTYLSLDDHKIDIELTPNRGDCASVRGIARELSVRFNLPLNIPTVSVALPEHSDTFPIVVRAVKECPRYVGRIIRHIRTDAVTPPWMQQRLSHSGIRTLHPVVDITNYVMLELGQPMHAFDLATLFQGLEVRLAHPGETLAIRDGHEVSLTPDTLVIADAKQVQAIAGIMGGKFSAVAQATQDIFLESAYFDPITIARAARQLGLITDASYRFERGVDFELQDRAMERCTELLLAICGGHVGPVSSVVAVHELPLRSTIFLRASEIQRILGITLPSESVETILQALGMRVQKNDVGWHVTPPSYRFDLSLEIDLIEELARLHGYQALPSTTLVGDLRMPSVPSAVLPYLRLPQLLADLGYTEIITYSFVDPVKQRSIDPEGEFLALVNPLAPDLSVMRTSLWTGLIQALQYNLNRQAERVRLFEMGLCFIQEGGELRQVDRVAGIFAGRRHHLQWGWDQRPVDFFDVKGDVEQLFSEVGGEADLMWQPSSHPALHPGQSADIYRGDCCVGHVGILHPRLALAFGLSLSPGLFEINLSSLVKLNPKKYQNISKFPAVRRDLAIVIEDKISAQAIKRNIQQSSGHLLIEMKIFDIYQGESIGVGKKSMALSLAFQDAERTMIDSDVNKIVEGVVAGLQREFNAILRA